MKKFCPTRFWRGVLFRFCVLLVFALPGIGFAQSNYTPSELDTLVSNIALYPDPLLVQVLTASTYGEQIPAASLWAQSHKNLTGESLATAMENANLTYDPSVQALIPFPSVLAMMAKYKNWCDQLGDAVTSQKDDVMEAVQRMRQSAYDHGHLKSDEKVSVSQTESNITIVPVRTEYVYVPVYNPRVVYYTYADGYTRISYGTGVWLGTWYGEWGWGSCWFDWGPRVIYVRNTRWYAHRPIPHHPRRYVPPQRHGFGPPPPPRHGFASPPPARHSTVAPKPSQHTVPKPVIRNTNSQPVRISQPPKPMAPGVYEAGATAVTKTRFAPAPSTKPAPVAQPQRVYYHQNTENQGSTRPAPSPSSRSQYDDDDNSNSGRGSFRSGGSQGRSSGGFGKVGRRR